METQTFEQPLTLDEFLKGDYESYEFAEGKLIPMAAAKSVVISNNRFVAIVPVNRSKTRIVPATNKGIRHTGQ